MCFWLSNAHRFTWLPHKAKPSEERFLMPENFGEPYGHHSVDATAVTWVRHKEELRMRTGSAQAEPEI